MLTAELGSLACPIMPKQPYPLSSWLVAKLTQSKVQDENPSCQLLPTQGRCKTTTVLTAELERLACPTMPKKAYPLMLVACSQTDTRNGMHCGTSCSQQADAR